MKVWALVLLFAVAYAKHEEYSGWKSYFVGPSTQEQRDALIAMKVPFDLDFLSYPLLEREGVILVKPEHQVSFSEALEKEGISYRIHSADVKASLDIDDQNIVKARQESLKRNGGKQIPYDSYQELEVIYEYLQDIANRYPEKVTLVQPATSFEGRPIYYLKISTTNFEDESKPVIFIDGGIHAREWITPPPITWAIHKLVEDVTEPDLLEKFDWILLPVVNPDGYKFTFTTNRFWRKTRSTDQHVVSFLCPGVDGNRNYDVFWNTVGASSNPCDDTFAGSQPFSEIETQVVRDILQEHLHRLPLYITMHSYGSMILYGWGHDGSLSNNALALHTVGVAMAEAIDAKSLPNFPKYIVGNSALVLNYAAAGASEDYAHYIGVPLAYTIELPGLAFGLNGFHLDPIYIQQVAIETWDAIVVGARQAGIMYPGIVTP